MLILVWDIWVVGNKYTFPLMENMTIPMKIFDDPRLKSIMISVNPRLANALKENKQKKH